MTRLFESLARGTLRAKWAVVVVWIVVAVAGARLLPNLSSVTSSNNSQFLPPPAPSQHAAALAAPFQAGNPSGTAFIVAARTDGPLTPADSTAIDQLEAQAGRISMVTAVRDLGSSNDGHARRALVATSITNPGAAGNSLVNGLRGLFSSVGAPAGLELHLAGPLAQAADASASNASAGSNIRIFTVLFVIVLLFAVYRSVLAPLATLLPAVLSLVLSSGLIAKAAEAGLPASPATQLLLPVLLLGAGADYGLFLVFRVREEVRAGAEMDQAIVRALGRVGASITFSAATVIVALGCLALSSFGIYRGLGPALAIGVAVLLLAGLTLVPALLGICGRALFWPSHPAPGDFPPGGWGRVAVKVVKHPGPVLLVGLVVFGVLSSGIVGFRTGGFASTASVTGSDSAAGTALIAAHFPAATASGETLLLRYPDTAWTRPDAITEAQASLSASAAIRSLTGPLDAGGQGLSPAQLSDLHRRLGAPQRLPPTPPKGGDVPPPVFRAYRSTAQFISEDGRTVQFEAVPAVGSVGTRQAVDGVPALRNAVAAAARASGATDSGVLSQDAVAYDINAYSTADLAIVVPAALLAIAILLGILLRSAVAPLYLIPTVALSYLATLGFATFVFIDLGKVDGLVFVIPMLLFIFAMALGEDYNILLMTRVREEAHASALADALPRAVARTGGTITSAGAILAGTFLVLALAGNSDQARQLGFTIAFAVLLDTFFVRTLLVPSVATLLGRWNWWPSALARA